MICPTVNMCSRSLTERLRQAQFFRFHQFAGNAPAFIPHFWLWPHRLLAVHKRPE